MPFDTFLKQPFWGAKIGDYLWFVVLVAVGLLLKKPFAKGITWLVARLTVRRKGGGDRQLFRSLIARPVEWLFAISLLYIACNHIDEPINRVVLFRMHRSKDILTLTLTAVLDHVATFFMIVFVAQLLSRITDFLYHTQSTLAQRTGQRSKAQLIPLLRDIARLLIGAICFLWILGAVFHVNVPSLIAGVGIGGVAIALAAKESVENLFASFTILADKPFASDDVIRLDGLEGTVERVGFRSTRLRGSDGSVYIIPNKKLVDENLENLSVRELKRMQLPITIKYGMPHAAVQELSSKLKEAVEKTEGVQQPVTVNVETFGENSFQLMVTYHLLPAVPDDSGKVKEAINLMAYDLVTQYTGAKPATTTGG